ncbi:MAG: gamma-glutamyl hercynylcysteine S-oxide synthase [Thermoleophilales bacterium]|nr:gamma-glutamyl hercynylcysteine S-oxide synthase [Thermoleophilales bacterium]
MASLHPLPLPLGGVDALDRPAVAALLAETRERTLALVEPVSEDDMSRVHDRLMSPLVWDLGHIAAFEDLWLCGELGGGALRPDLLSVYDATETPRAERGEIPFLRLDAAHAYLRAVRGRALEVLQRPGALAEPIWDMVIRHEQQHNETMLQTLKLAEPGVFTPPAIALPHRPPFHAAARKTLVDAGPFELGADAGGFAYDNERARHTVDVPAFEIDVTPVTNGAYRAWVDGGGYERRSGWSDAGWEWRTREGIERPLYWTADGRVRWFDQLEQLDPAAPVMHVSWYEADAYARSRGERLPTEVEWEKAACHFPASRLSRRYPWGDEAPTADRANLDQLAFRAASPGAFPAGASPHGCVAMIGDVWEWTAGDFGAYPGFAPFPYEEYSSIFFGPDYKVLRGGSWATRPRVATTTFRNWDLPVRRQIFSGFRCARDV